MHLYSFYKVKSALQTHTFKYFLEVMLILCLFFGSIFLLFLPDSSILIRNTNNCQEFHVLKKHLPAIGITQVQLVCLKGLE